MFMGAIVRSPADIQQCHAIRFRVYCVERNFLDSSAFQTESEEDEFDPFATHLAVYGPAGGPLATARVVHHSSLGFPLQRYCKAKVPKELLTKTGEVSRLAVPRSVTQKYSERGTPAFASRRVSVKLYQAVYRYAKLQKLTHLIATMEPALVRIFSGFSIPWMPIGQEVNYGGMVRPYLLSLAEFDSIFTPAALRFRGAL